MIMRLFPLALVAAAGLAACAPSARPGPAGQVRTDGLQPKFTAPSRFVPARTVQVWLPPDYWTSHRRYPVLYMHDGQNIFEEPAPFSGRSWHVQKTLARAQASLDALDRNVTSPDAPVQHSLQDTLLELQRASRSLRVLSDYLQQHPESILRGKPPDPALSPR